MKKSPAKFFLKEHLLSDEHHHGGIGCKDIERILLRNDFQPLEAPAHFNFSVKAKLLRVFFCIKTILSLPIASIVVFQNPLYATINRFLIRYILFFRKDITVVCIVTDIDGLKDANQNLLAKELRLFRKIRHFVVHNDAMMQWLQKQIPSARISMLQFFDFLIDIPVRSNHLDYSIAFAGFLDKSKFIFDLNKIDKNVFHLYGPTSFDMSTPGVNVHYHGVFSNERLLKYIEGSFGLVWDGDGINNLQGIFGDYNKFISPHKLSLYIVAGLPVIAHVSSGSASLIQKYKIGLLVNSLFEIEEKIRNVSGEEYDQMKQNCKSIAVKVSEGQCLEEALEDLGLAFHP